MTYIWQHNGKKNNTLLKMEYKKYRVMLLHVFNQKTHLPILSKLHNMPVPCKTLLCSSSTYNFLIHRPLNQQCFLRTANQSISHCTINSLQSSIMFIHVSPLQMHIKCWNITIYDLHILSCIWWSSFQCISQWILYIHTHTHTHRYVWFT